MFSYFHFKLHLVTHFNNQVQLSKVDTIIKFFLTKLPAVALLIHHGQKMPRGGQHVAFKYSFLLFSKTLDIILSISNISKQQSTIFRFSRLLR